MEHAFNGGTAEEIFDTERQYEVYTPDFHDDFDADYVAPEVSFVEPAAVFDDPDYMDLPRGQGDEDDKYLASQGSSVHFALDDPDFM